MGGLEYAGIIVPILLLIVLLEYAIARYKKVEAFSLTDTLVNMCCGMLERLFDVFWVVMMYFVFQFLYEHVALWSIPANVGTWILALLVGDLLAYWHHRLSHEVNFLWAAHIVHHSSEELNVTTVFRVSAFAVINRSFFWIWMPLMGFSPLMTTGAIVFIGLFQFFTHTRLVGKLGILEYFMVTPSHHRVHHARNEKYLDKNYGHVFIIWDKLFGTFAPEEEEPDYGITNGLHSSNPYRVYLHYWQDLFRRAKEAKRWQDKLRVFVAPPTYNPQGASPAQHEYQTDEQGNRLKYRNDAPFRLQLYAFGAVMMTMAAFMYIMVLKNTFESPTVSTLLSDPRMILLAILIATSIFAHGVIMERKPWALRVEWLRLIMWGIFLPVITWNTPFNWLVLPLSLLVVGIFSIWLLRLRDQFRPEREPAAA
jgi:alkylglycerol monooxygenase